MATYFQYAVHCSPENTKTKGKWINSMAFNRIFVEKIVRLIVLIKQKAKKNVFPNAICYRFLTYCEASMYIVHQNPIYCEGLNINVVRTKLENIQKCKQIDNNFLYFYVCQNMAKHNGNQKL